jgi:hypothetical protein
MLVPIIPYYNLRNTNTQVQVGAVLVCTLDIHSKTKKKICFVGNNYKKRNRNVGWGIASKCCVHGNGVGNDAYNICIYYTCQYLRYTNTKRKTNTKEKRIKKRKKNENTIL